MAQEVDLAHAVSRESACSSSDNTCAEIAFLGDAVALRDSKDRGGPVLVFTPREWTAFLGGVLDGEFDRP